MPESSRVGDSVQQRYCAGNDFEKRPKAGREQAERIREADQREREGREEGGRVGATSTGLCGKI